MAEAYRGFSANISVLFTELPYHERPAAARRAGFDSVETWWPFSSPSPGDAEIDAFVTIVGGAGVQLDTINLYAGDMAHGERGIACRPDRGSELAANVPVVAQIGERLGCRKFNLLYGQLDGRWTVAEQLDSAVRGYSRAAATLRDIGGVVLVEALTKGANGNYPLGTPDQVTELLDGPLAGCPNVAVLFDLFHFGSNGVDLPAAAAQLSGRIGHVQIADAPGRGQPGTGALPLQSALAAIRANGYGGLVGCEYLPQGTTADSLRWLADPGWIVAG